MNIMWIYSTFMTCGTAIGIVGWLTAISLLDKVEKLKDEITNWRAANAWLRGKGGISLHPEEDDNVTEDSNK